MNKYRFFEVHYQISGSKTWIVVGAPNTARAIDLVRRKHDGNYVLIDAVFPCQVIAEHTTSESYGA